MGVRCEDRIFNCCEISILQSGRDHLPDLFHLSSDSGITVEVPVELPTKGIRELSVALRTQTAVIERLVKLRLAPTHELGMALATEPEEFRHRREELLTGPLTKLSAKPCLIMVSDGTALDTIDVPRHVEEQFKVVACHLRVVDIGNPQFPDIVVIGRPHFVIDESGLHRREPQIIVGTAPVAEVIVDTTAPTAFLFLGITQARHVSIVIITPHQRDIVGHLQSFLIDLQHLFIRNEDLHLLRRVTDIFAQQILLVVDDLLQGIELLLHGLHAFHGPVMDATHANGKHIPALGAFHLLETFDPIVLYGLFVRDIIEPSALGHIPFVNIIAQEWLTVTGSHDDATAVGHGFITGDLEERRRARVHGRPDSIGTEPEHQLEDLLVGLRSDGTELRLFKSAVAPRTQRPVLIIEEDATVFDRGTLKGREMVIDSEPVLVGRHDIAPPDPRTDARHARQFEETIGGTAAVTTDNHDLSVMNTDIKAVGLCL